MKLVQTAPLFAAALMLISSAALAEKKLQNKPLKVRLMEAVDARDASNGAFEEALKAGKLDSLAMRGQIGGDACEKLIPSLRSSNANIRTAAAKGAQLCHDTKLSSVLLSQLQGKSSKEQSAFARALGFSGTEDARQVLAKLIAEDSTSTETKTAALYGLMQNIVYAGIKAGNIEGLDADVLMELLESDVHQYAAAYLLVRLRSLPDFISSENITAGLAARLDKGGSLSAGDVPTLRLLVRVAREYGDRNYDFLVRAAASHDRSIRHEAISSLGRLSNVASRDFLLDQLAEATDPAIRHLAIDAIGRMSAADSDLVEILERYIGDENGWVATTALRWLGQRDPDAAIKIAAKWLEGENYYRAFQALQALVGSDAGKEVLKIYAAANPDTVRGFEAAVALDPSLEAITKPRSTPSQASVRAYAGRELVLETTRGNICIAATGDAPYATTNFFKLADVGKMDGMLWHRVIPNFVTQAGQIEDRSLANWGSIREEWGGEHRIGTVGVATAGRDTGTTQFFINTAYNMHLNDRYTVFAKVIGGMDVVYDLQEGDVISKAYTEKPNSATCK